MSEEETTRLLVKLRPERSARFSVSASANTADLRMIAVHDVIPQARLQRLVVPRDEEAKALATLRARDDVEYVEVERPMRVRQAAAVTVVPNDPRFLDQWGLVKINAPAAWGISTGTSAVTVAVVDTGIQLDHPDLSGRLVTGADCTVSPCRFGTGQGNDGHGHGTHVAGIVAAGTNNGIGVAGVAYGSAVKLMPVKVLADSGEGTSGNVANGIRWAVDNGARVINLSVGGPFNSPSINSEIDNAYLRGVLVVVSAGNCGDPLSAKNDYSCNYTVNNPDYPAAYAAQQPDRLIPVAATNSTDGRAYFSTAGSYVKLAGVSAPGASILSTYAGSTYRGSSGTSMAAPHVAGLAALLWSTRPSLTLDQVRSAIRSTATTVDLGVAGADEEFGVGRIDALRALQAIVPTPTPTPTATPTSTLTPTASPTHTATATATATVGSTATTAAPSATPTATPSVTSTRIPTSTAQPPPPLVPTATATSIPPPLPAVAEPSGGSGGSSASGGPSGGGSSGSGVGSAERLPVSIRNATGSPAATGMPAPSAAATVYTINPAGPAGMVQIQGNGVDLFTADFATTDPATERRRFRGWLRSDSGPIFGVSLDGRLEWISPDDAQDLAEVDWAKVQTIPDAALTAVPLAQPRVGWLLWDFRGSGRIYVVQEDGLLHYIPDMTTFLAHFQWKNVLPVNAAQIAQLPQGEGLPSVAGSK